MKNPHLKTIIAAGCIAVLIIGGLLFWDDIALLDSNSATAALGTISPPPSGPIDASAIAQPAPPPPGFVKYQNERYGFYFYHSPEGVIKEFDEGEGAMTVVLENEEKMRGLQIFIVPYKEESISEERFKADVPSGVRTNVEDTTVGKLGIRAVTFNSYDEMLGETRELWFIYRGYLYEVTTFKNVRDWFTPIIQTWRFL